MSEGEDITKSMEKNERREGMSHMTADETRKFLELLIETTSSPSSTTPSKGYISKKSWDVICEKYFEAYPRFNRSSLQNRWERLKKSYYAHMDLLTPVSGSDVNGNLPPEAEVERARTITLKRKEASLAQKSGCIDLLAQLLEGARATGEFVISNPLDLTRPHPPAVMRKHTLSESELDETESIRKCRRGSPAKKNKRRKVSEREERFAALEQHRKDLDEKFERMIALLTKVVENKSDQCEDER
eukprot:TRINITY_DN5090_c0_g2_i1.p1 TRINITY_DN5090_c0_g2~~TRINITY_DN5090_c0_g2_i1.p1  ORF type:complete len:244 (-),score=57.13 TRINITY_DN5090_c0_g2_i1:59-790(-)